MIMDYFHHYIEEYLKEALLNSNGTNSGISEYLWEKKDPGRFASHRIEKIKALREVRRVFDDYRHWPLSIILSHLAVEDKESFLSLKK
jgi:hypothetical protein